MPQKAPPSVGARTRRRVAGYLVPGVLVGLVGLGSRYAEAKLGAPAWLYPAALALTLVICARLVVVWWNSFDEVAREAHREAWLWGGSAGLAVSVLLLVTVTNYSSAFGLAVMNPVRAFTMGTACVFLPLSAGYLIWWAAWWLKRR